MQPIEVAQGRTPVRSTLEDDPDFRDLLEMFAASLREATETLRSLFAAGDVAQLQREAHKLKGSGGGYGFPGLTTEAAALESACKAGDLMLVQQALSRLLDYAARIEV
jgi:HPt (histidine-containing phosphotransfer) domain-containing protein